MGIVRAQKQDVPSVVDKKTCLPVQQEEKLMCSCQTRRHVFLLQKNTCLFVQHKDASSCWTRRHVFLLNRETCLLVRQEDMSSCRTTRHVFSSNKNTRLLVEQHAMSSCSTRTHVTAQGAPSPRQHAAVPAPQT